MINIVFLLLIFFVVAGTLERSNPQTINIPIATSDSFARGNPVIVSLARGGKISFDGVNVSQDKLPELLKKAVEQDDNVLITIRADRNLPAHSLTKLISIVYKHGSSNLAIEIEQS